MQRECWELFVENIAYNHVVAIETRFPFRAEEIDNLAQAVHNNTSLLSLSIAAYAKDRDEIDTFLRCALTAKHLTSLHLDVRTTTGRPLSPAAVNGLFAKPLSDMFIQFSKRSCFYSSFFDNKAAHDRGRKNILAAAECYRRIQSCQTLTADDVQTLRKRLPLLIQLIRGNELGLSPTEQERIVARILEECRDHDIKHDFKIPNAWHKPYEHSVISFPTKLHERRRMTPNDARRHQRLLGRIVGIDERE